ncbi:MAG: quinolinate synthase NadA [Clostridia bacterium]|nr:quinolinate synthase NadA [Clostridia bacterium]
MTELTAEATASELTAAVRALKEERRAIILAHNYQVPEVQDVADVVGDSLALAQAAAASDAPVIVFCGVHFMAETAAILCPDKTVLLPDLEAGCSLADSITVEQLRAWKAEHPGAVVVAYVNTSAAVKAESDYCCTSANAVKVIESIPPDREILFLPDMFLGSYVRTVTGRPIHVWMGECHVHAGLAVERIEAARRAHPEAELLVHPECGCVTACMAHMAWGDIPAAGTHVLSTNGMLRHARSSPARSFVVATEVGLLHQLRRQNPDKAFYPVDERAVCQYMKRITLEKVYRSLRDGVYRVTVDAETAARARRAIERMLTIV